MELVPFVAVAKAMRVEMTRAREEEENIFSSARHAPDAVIS
jgi:hypothetical protein